MHAACSAHYSAPHASNCMHATSVGSRVARACIKQTSSWVMLHLLADNLETQQVAASEYQKANQKQQQNKQVYRKYCMSISLMTSPPGGDAALVGKVSRDAALVPLLSSADEGGVKDQAILGGVALGLQGPEERLFCPQDLDSGCWILCQVGQ